MSASQAQEIVVIARHKDGTTVGGWFTTAPAIDPRFKQTLDWSHLTGKMALVAYPDDPLEESASDYRDIISTWVNYAWSAFCLQWVALGWAILCGTA